MEFVGNLLKRIDLREGDSQHGHWRIATYLLETVEMYPKRMVVDVSDGEYAQRIDQFDELIGKNVKVAFDIDAREWNGKWYNSIRAFGIRENVSEAETGNGHKPAGKATGTKAGDGREEKTAKETTGTAVEDGHGQNPAGETTGTAAAGGNNPQAANGDASNPASFTDDGTGDDDLPF